MNRRDATRATFFCLYTRLTGLSIGASMLILCPLHAFANDMTETPKKSVNFVRAIYAFQYQSWHVANNSDPLTTLTNPPHYTIQASPLQTIGIEGRYGDWALGGSAFIRSSAQATKDVLGLTSPLINKALKMTIANSSIIDGAHIFTRFSWSEYSVSFDDPTENTPSVNFSTPWEDQSISLVDTASGNWETGIRRQNYSFYQTTYHLDAEGTVGDPLSQSQMMKFKQYTFFLGYSRMHDTLVRHDDYSGLIADGEFGLIAATTDNPEYPAIFGLHSRGEIGWGYLRSGREDRFLPISFKIVYQVDYDEIGNSSDSITTKAGREVLLHRVDVRHGPLIELVIEF